MGMGSYSADEYSARLSLRASTGKSAMTYTDDVISKTSYHDQKIHESLDPKNIKGYRESLDVPGKPLTTPIIVAFDQTGSMGGVPRAFQLALPKLMGMLIRGGYVENPQLLIAAIGDHRSDRAIFQAGQFESDVRIEDGLANMWLEGGGGGNMAESYELAMYFAARKTKTSAKDRGDKGYLFLTGDEMASDVSKAAVKQVFGDTIQADIPLKDILEEVREDWHVHFIMPGGTNHWNNSQVDKFWRGLMGECYHRLEDYNSLCELIGSIIGQHEGYDLKKIKADIQANGGDPSVATELAVRTSSKDLAVSVPSSGKKSGVAKF